MNQISERWKKFCERRDGALMRSGRTASELSVVAVSKLHTPTEIGEHLRTCVGFPRELGENYLQELAQKVVAPELSGIRWHFIGALQSRKIAEVASLVSCIHSVGRIKELEILADALFEGGNDVDFYFQFNASREGTKNGFELGEAAEVSDALERLRLMDRCRGVMCSAAPLEDVGKAEVRATFGRLREVRDAYFAGKKLNMGMSSDFEIAIEEGSDLIRVGTVLFGERS